jgi:DNA invertase Pin-like site-specific DNA recombinase
MRAITYARVSTGKQAESGLSLDDQAERMGRELERRGWEHVEAHTDAGRSGRTGKSRPALEAALDALAAGEADALVVAKLDRLARSTIALSRIMQTSQEQGWSLVILDPDLDTSTAAGRLTATVLGAVAEYESELIADRARMTHRRRKAAGKRAGQAPILSDELRTRIYMTRHGSSTPPGRETFQAIADDLNAEGIPTAKGGRWHASTVRHVCMSVERDAELAEMEAAAA